MSTLNLGTIKTPGVYVDEMSLFPPSVAQVDTAIPVFIGPTRIAYSVGQPVRISSMAEYRSLYGGSPDRALVVNLNDRNMVQSVDINTAATQPQYLHDSLLLYFNNGGEKCYIVSTGTYNDSLSTGSFTNPLAVLKKFDEPTLLVMPDAVRLGADNLGVVQKEVLAHCRAMQDRFAILDVYMGTTLTNLSTSQINGLVSTFRTNVGTENLNYGAAYFPYLQTTLPASVTYADLTLKRNNNTVVFADLLADNPDAQALAQSLDKVAADRNKIRAQIQDLTTPLLPSLTAFQSAADYAARKTQLTAALTNFATKFTGAQVFTYAPVASDYTAAIDTTAGSPRAVLAAAIAALVAPPTNATQIAAYDQVFDRVSTYIGSFVDKVETRLQALEAELKRKSPLYASIAKGADSMSIVVPPSGAIAGAYARTDNERGVWKSPANVSLNYVAGPVVNLTDSEQDGLNVDPTDGKSINAVRAFTGKGTLVWGARTLAGSDNEWRYVSVRRFFLMAEESIKKATAQFVFEANDANTWVRVRAMIENFLTLQWRAGALAGSKADNAFFVRVGLGQTMTPQDVLNGFMIIEIGMAVVRPAEFIVLRFSHKMQEA